MPATKATAVMTSDCVIRCRSDEGGSADESCRPKKHQSKRISERRSYPPHEADEVGGEEKDSGRGVGVGTVTRGSSEGGNLSHLKRNPSEINPPTNNNTSNASISRSRAQSSTEAFPQTDALGDLSTGMRRPTLDVPSTATAPATRGNSASLSSNSSALTSASSGRTQMKVIYYQNRFIAIPIPATTHNQRQPSIADDKNEDDDDVTSGSVNPLPDGSADVIGAQYASQPYHQHHNPHHYNNPTSGRSTASTQEVRQMDRKSYLVLRFIELLHDKDRQPKRTKKEHRSCSVPSVLVKCLNLFFLAMGILLFVGVLIAIAFSSVMQWMNVPK